MTAIIIGEGESFYRKGTVMKKTRFEKKKKFRRLAAVSLALCMAAVGMACGNGEYEADMEDKSRLVYAEYVGATGWRIVNVIPKKALLSGASQMRKITYVAFFAMVSISERILSRS